MNPFVMKNKDDEDERNQVVDDYKIHFDEQFKTNARLVIHVHYLASLVSSGKKIALRCWCSPKRCHGHVIINKINEITGFMNPQVETTELKKIPAFLVEKYKPEDIDYTECRFAVHIPKRNGKHDWHMVKEIVHFKDGTSAPNIRYLQDYKIRFWVAKTNLRKNYTQKKEWENRDALNEIETTQSDLWHNVAIALDQRHLAKRPFDLKDSPHLYGTDIPSTVTIKHEYFERMRGRDHTPFNISYSDTETNMLGLDQGRKKNIIMQSLFYEGKMYLVVLEDFLKTVPNPKQTILAMYDKYMPEQGKALVKELTIEIVKEPIDIVRGVMKKAHDWKPDFMAFWNLLFDMDKMIECIEDAGYDPADIFSDPNLPEQLRYFYFKRANPNKTSASGRTMTKKPADQWHTVFTPASFYFICQMASYRFIRKSKQLEKGYGLDDILKKELKGLGKLKLAEVEGLNKEMFHITMQQMYPAEYVIYHMWDVVCMPVLDAETKDLSYSLPGSIEFSDFASFDSEPKRYVHTFHMWALKERNSVTGVSGNSLVQEFDSMTISGKGHIITLEPHLTIDSGLYVFKDYPGLRTNFYAFCGDLDVKSSYPYGQWIFNMSRMTTVRELISIEGVTDADRRIQGLNLSGGRSNAIEFATVIYKLPTLAELDKFYDKAKVVEMA